MRIAALLCVGLTLAALGTVASARADDEPKGYMCTFATGVSWSYDKGTFKRATPAPLQFEITDIDLDRQSAHLVTDEREKPGTLRIVRAINANHYLEVVNEGFLNLTTIYDKDPATGTHPAVHSRHFGLIGQPVFAQYAGTCIPK
jgi:hypothetical protein